MKIVDVYELPIRDVKVVQFARFRDDRGYFTETFRRGAVTANAAAGFLHDLSFPQSNESLSRAGVVRGLHFQWQPYMGKLVRTVSGRMVDLVLDIRLGSPTFGTILAHDMPARPDADTSEWIWVPPGFAHGNFFTEESVIEYLCTGEYAQGNEAGISPVAEDLDWTACDAGLRGEFEALVADQPVLSEKDRAGHTLAAWRADPRAQNFLYDELSGAS